MNRQDWSQVKLLALDFDGVMTDAKVTVGTDGVESVVCSHADGQGIELVRNSGIPVVVISGQKSAYVDPRCQKMKIDFFKSVKDKPACLREYLADKHPGITLEQVCFVGDDHSDRKVLKIVGFPVAVANATTEIKSLAVHITNRNGGDGGVREVCDALCASRDQSSATSDRNILITGTGERATEVVCFTAKELAYKLSLLGHTILTNGGPNGVPEAVATGVKKAVENNGIGRSIAYTYLPGATAEKCGTTAIRQLPSFEVRNGAVCADADVAVFFQGGFGTMGKLFPMMHRVLHINDLLEKKGASHLVKQKQIILHTSFVKPENCAQLFGSTFSDKHQQILSFASSAEEILDLIGKH